MKAAEYDKLQGMERIRLANHAFRDVPEGFLAQFSLDELLRLHRAWALSTHTIPPHLWDGRQVRDAVDYNVPPMFGPHERPLPPLAGLEEVEAYALAFQTATRQGDAEHALEEELDLYRRAMVSMMQERCNDVVNRPPATELARAVLRAMGFLGEP